MTSWSPWKSWWLDVLKFGITFFLGALMTITVVDTLQERRAERTYAARIAWERDVATIEEFRAASLLYVQASEDALAQASRGLGHPDNEIVRRWRKNGHDRMLLAIEIVEDRFSHHSGVAAALHEFEDTMNQLYGEFLELRDSIHEPSAYMWSPNFVRLKELRRTMARSLERAISARDD